MDRTSLYMQCITALLPSSLYRIAPMLPTSSPLTCSTQCHCFVSLCVLRYRAQCYLSFGSAYEKRWSALIPPSLVPCHLALLDSTKLLPVDLPSAISVMAGFYVHVVCNGDSLSPCRFLVFASSHLPSRRLTIGCLSQSPGLRNPWACNCSESRRKRC